MTKEFEVTPWNVKGEVDYGKIEKEFGIQRMQNLPEIFMRNLFFRRRIIFAQRDFSRITNAIKRKKKFVMMTGLMPSGKMHLGHVMVLQQAIFYQKLGAKIYIGVADLEAYNTRRKSLVELKQTAIEQYLINYIALGLELKDCDVYFQSARSKDAEKSNAYYRLASNFSRYATFNEFKAVYGEISPGKMNASLLQAADMFHPQLPEFDGEIATVIPVGVDQDPHIRIARDIGARYKDNKLMQISSTYHFFLPSLKSGKMSSSDENSYISLTDSAREVETKIKKYAFSGGRDTIEEHRKLGGNPDVDVSFQYLRFLFEPDDSKLEKIEKDYRSGKMLTSELKKITIEKINTFLREHQKKREKARKEIGKFVWKG